MSSKISSVNLSKVNKAVFFPALLITFIMGMLFIMRPVQSAAMLAKIHAFTTNQLGWFFLVVTFAVLSFCIFLGCSRYGNIVLGEKGEKPDFPTFVWLCFIFTSGTGGSIMYLSAVEWIWIIQNPPFGVIPKSPEALNWAYAYGMFHWGPSAWAFYLVSAICIGYFFFVKKKKTMVISKFTTPFLGKYSQGLGGHVINFLYRFGSLGGVMTSLALGTPLISSILAYVIGMEKSNAFLDTLVITLWTLIPLIALISGLTKGVALLNKWNIRADFVLLICITILGPFWFILNQTVDGIGLMMQNFIRMSLTTDVIGKGGFPQSWTIFYFSWWVVYSLPFGLFIAKISRNRTIRELVFGGLIAGSLGCMMFYMVLSGFGMNLYLSGTSDLVQILNDSGRGMVVVEILKHLPFSLLFIAAFGLIVLISYVAGHCTVGYALAAATQHEMGEHEDPLIWNVTFWLILVGIVSLGLYFINPASLGPLQTISILTGMPLCFVIFILCKSFLIQVKQDYPKGLPDRSEHE